MEALHLPASPKLTRHLQPLRIHRAHTQPACCSLPPTPRLYALPPCLCSCSPGQPQPFACVPPLTCSIWKNRPNAFLRKLSGSSSSIMGRPNGASPCPSSSSSSTASPPPMPPRPRPAPVAAAAPDAERELPPSVTDSCALMTCSALANAA